MGFIVHLLPTAEPRLVITLIPVPMWLIAHAWGGRARSPAIQPAPQMVGT